MNPIRYYRRMKGLTLKCLAEKTGLTEPSLCRYEHDQREMKIKTAARIAAALGIRMEDLVNEKEDCMLG